MWKEVDNVSYVQTFKETAGQWVVSSIQEWVIYDILVELYSTYSCYIPNALET